MQENTVTKKELFNACSVLFGSDVNVTVDFLKYLQMSGLKAAYRKRALETHPDRAMALAEQPMSLEERFKEVNLAYSRLIEFIEYPWRFPLEEKDTFRRSRSAHTPVRRKRKEAASPTPRKAGRYSQQNMFRGFREHFWQCDLPGKRLLIGRFLYYSGIISSRALIEAIVWQKRQRPAVGIIATQWDWLDQRDILKILSQRRPNEKFGECALRRGYLNRYQLTLLLGRQRLLQPRIGVYFVEQNILNARQLESFVEKLRLHNRKYWRF
jgi:hypothetical protein